MVWNKGFKLCNPWPGVRVPAGLQIALQALRVTMTKAISAFLLLAMLIQVIRPLGLPGLRKRGDFWKLAVVAFVLWSLTLLLRP